MAMILKEKKALNQAFWSQKVPPNSVQQLHAMWNTKMAKKADVIVFWCNLAASGNPTQQVAAYGDHLQSIRGQVFVRHFDVGARCHPRVEDLPRIG
ncbi:MAG: hypothetical protein V4679_11290 [Pseudomonadota bacterium]